ncbi:hypothetical protein B0H13DRAFT_2046994 [Mycena leptocephala]|nr:hypothetical protein B0H13DRAFT_2046994 [Mycena leptocephala]
MTRTMNVVRPWPISGIGFMDAAPENIVLLSVENLNGGAYILCSQFYPNLNNETIKITVARTVQGNATRLEVCHDVSSLSTPPAWQNLHATVVCNYSWADLAEARDHLVLLVYLPDPSGILHVKQGQGNPSDVNSYADVIPLMAGSHLSALFSLKQRDLFSKNAQDLLGITTPFRSIYLNSVLLVQPDPFPLDLGPNEASLRLRMRNDIVGPVELVQEYTDASVLDGLATFGGFWTFVNGVFAMVFGANLLYFLLRRRSLSALGIVHIFQRRRLIRNWNEDFPALYTEGGQPGSSSAGVVAFLRERLVDLDDEDTQHSSSDPVHPVVLKDEPDALNPPVDSISTEIDILPNTV